MLNGVIMSEDRVVAKVRRNNCIVFDPNHCPLYLMRYNDPEGWLTRRAIDESGLPLLAVRPVFQ